MNWPATLLLAASIVAAGICLGLIGRAEITTRSAERIACINAGMSWDWGNCQMVQP